MSETVKEILARLTGASHRGGAFSSDVLIAIAEVLPEGELTTIETGCGKSTIMFSNLSVKHYVFAYDDRGSEESSVLLVQDDEQFKAEHTVFVYGPTQQTLRGYVFPEDEMFDVILLDGPHGYPFPDLEYALLYERLKVGGILILDDVHIASIGRMYDILREDRMYDEIGVFATTGLLRRTAIEGVPPDGDHWNEQSYNVSRFPLAMDKYHLDRTLPLRTPVNIADPGYLSSFAIKSIERADGTYAAQTIDIGASLKLDMPKAAQANLTLEIEYQSTDRDACRDALVIVDGIAFPLAYSKEWSIAEMPVERPESGSLLVTFVHPNAEAEHDIGRARYDFRRIGSLIRSIMLTNRPLVDAKDTGRASSRSITEDARSTGKSRDKESQKEIHYISHVASWFRSNGGMERDIRLLTYLSRHFRVKMIYLGVLTALDTRAIKESPIDFEILDIGTGSEQKPEDWVDRFRELDLLTSKADAYLFRCLDNAYMVDAVPEGAKTLLDSMDLVSERSKKGTDSDNVLSKMTQEQEVNEFRRFDHIICIQEEESKLVSEWIGREHVITAKHPVEISPGRAERDRRRIGIVASSWAPNAYGLRDFIQNCWPTVRRQGASLDVFGNVVDVLNASVPSVRFHGYVEDLNKCFSEQGIFINPVQYGAGLKIKSIEALAHGMPLVSSREGASGLEHLDGKALLIADSWGQFSEHIIALMHDEGRCRELSENGLRYVQEYLNEDACFGELRERILSS